MSKTEDQPLGDSAPDEKIPQPGDRVSISVDAVLWDWIVSLMEDRTTNMVRVQEAMEASHQECTDKERARISKILTLAIRAINEGTEFPSGTVVVSDQRGGLRHADVGAEVMGDAKTADGAAWADLVNSAVGDEE